MNKTMRNILVWLGLLGLLVLTVLVWILDQGSLGTVLGLLIAGAKAALLIAFFMHLRQESARTMLMAGGVLFWLLILFGLTLADYYTRFQS